MVDEDEKIGEPLDLLDPKSSFSFVSMNQKQQKRKQEFPLAGDGRLVITEPELSRKKRKASEEPKIDENDEMSEEETVEQKNLKFNKKVSKEPPSKMPKKHTGDVYKAKKAKGDVLKPGKLEPFAYVPLNPKFLNKRRKAKAINQFTKYTTKKGAK